MLKPNILIDKKYIYRLCSLQGSDLLQVYNSGMEGLVLNVLGSKTTYSQPIMPGIYHLGLYQRQSGNKFYHANGERV
jgi:hypothetical protein